MMDRPSVAAVHLLAHAGATSPPRSPTPGPGPCSRGRTPPEPPRRLRGRLTHSRRRCFTPGHQRPFRDRLTPAHRGSRERRKRHDGRSAARRSHPLQRQHGRDLLLRELGGPTSITAFCRSVGDGRTRLDRSGPELNSAEPWRTTDTTTPPPRAIGRTYARLTLGDASTAPDRNGSPAGCSPTPPAATGSAPVSPPTGLSPTRPAVAGAAVTTTRASPGRPTAHRS